VLLIIVVKSPDRRNRNPWIKCSVRKTIVEISVKQSPKHQYAINHVRPLRRFASSSAFGKFVQSNSTENWRRTFIVRSVISLGDLSLNLRPNELRKVLPRSLIAHPCTSLAAADYVM
jgi:hypothetical protein